MTAATAKPTTLLKASIVSTLNARNYFLANTVYERPSGAVHGINSGSPLIKSHGITANKDIMKNANSNRNEPSVNTARIFTIHFGNFTVIYADACFFLPPFSDAKSLLTTFIIFLPNFELEA